MCTIENGVAGVLAGGGCATREPASECAQRGESIKARNSRRGRAAWGNTAGRVQLAGEQQGGFLVTYH